MIHPSTPAPGRNLPPDMLAFIAGCERLANERGERAAAFVGASLDREALVFDSPGLKVARSDVGGLEIRIIYIDTESGQKVSNPIIQRNSAGEIYRRHGTWRWGQKRLARLLAGETPEGPIRLGKGEDGWTTGID